MKKAIRLLAVVLCVVMVASTFAGCTFKIDIDLKGDGLPVANVVPETPATQAPATQAPATQAPTAAPATDAPAATAPTDAPAADTPTTDAPATDAPAVSADPATTEEIVAEYVKVYNTTKATGTFLGKSSMECASVKINGKEQGALKTLAGSIITSNGTDQPLMPYKDDNPGNECLVTPADVASATYKNNGDGTATIKIIPKGTVNDKIFEGAQGKFFNVMEDVGSALANISVISWAEGDANSNTTLTTDGGYAEVTYNIESKMMTNATYVLITNASVEHCNVTFFKDQAGEAQFVYTVTYPQ